MRLLLASLLVLATSPVAALERLDYELLSRVPHSRTDFVQGLEIVDGDLYQGTGKWGQSRLQRFELSSGELRDSRALPAMYFGEGVTVLEHLVVQLDFFNRCWTAKSAVPMQ